MSSQQLGEGSAVTQFETLAPPLGMVSHWCLTDYKLTEVDFEWNIRRLDFLTKFESWGNFFSTHFSSKETSDPEWLLHMHDVGPNMLIDLHKSSQTQTAIGSPIKVEIAILNENRYKIFPKEHCILANKVFPHRVFVIEKKVLLQCFVNGEVTIYFKIENLASEIRKNDKWSTVTDSRDKLIINNSEQLADHMGDLFENMKYSDITINIRGREFKAHKTILGSRSSVFAAMFEHPTKENLNNHIEIKDVYPDVFQQTLRFIYTGRVSEQTLRKMSPEILAVADKYLLDKLKMECEIQLTRRMSVDNCLQLLLIADENHPAYRLRNYAVDFFRRFSGEVMVTDEWEQAKKDHPQKCFSMLEELVSKSLV